MSKFPVTIRKNAMGVQFSIGHQTFTLNIVTQPDDPEWTRQRDFMAAMLRQAFTNLTDDVTLTWDS